MEDGISDASDVITAHLNDTDDAHDASAISVLDTGNQYTGTNVETVLAELPSRYLAQTTTQSAENADTQLFQAVPKTAGVAPFQVILNSFPNSAGSDPYNHMVMFGFNAARYTGGSVTANRPAVYMGFEDNYYDPLDTSTGGEWYTGYVSPDGTSVPIAALRPFYWRILNGMDNSALKNVRINMDIGAGDTGILAVFRGISANPNPLFEITKTNIIARTQFSLSQATAVMLITSTTGSASVFLNAKTTGYFTFKIDSAEAGGIIVASANTWYFVDKAGTPTQVMTYGATVAASQADFRMSVKVGGNVGFYGTTPIAKPTVTGSRGSNAALASLLTALSSLGLVTDSSS